MVCYFSGYDDFSRLMGWMDGWSTKSMFLLWWYFIRPTKLLIRSDCFGILKTIKSFLTIVCFVVIIEPTLKSRLYQPSSDSYYSPLLTLLAVKNSLQFVVEFYFQLSFLFVSFRFFFLFFSGSMLQLEFYCALLGFLVLPMKKKKGAHLSFSFATQKTIYATHDPPTHPSTTRILRSFFFYRDRRTTQKLVFPFHSKLTSPRTHHNLAFVFFLSACKFIHVSPHSPLFYFFLPYIQNG